MLADVVDFLACPACHGDLHTADGALRCERGHAYDIARQGYVTLRHGSGPQHGGDDAAMVTARHQLLAAGTYAGLADHIAQLTADAYVETLASRAGTEAHHRGLVVDAGGGTGYYLGAVLGRLGSAAAAPAADARSKAATDGPNGLVLDASPYALRRAARAHAAIAAVGCDLWQRWPVKDGVASLVLDIFAPRNGAETRRVLAEEGRCLVVAPGAGHLAELVAALGLLEVDGRKQDRIAATLEPHLTRRAIESYEQTLQLRHHDIATVVGMSPSARHLEPALRAARIGSLPDPTDVTLSVTVGIWSRA